MFSFTSRRTAVLAVVLWLVVCFVPNAGAAQTRSRTGSLILEGLSVRTLILGVTDLWRGLPLAKTDPPPPNNPGNDPHHPSNQEGSAGCPMGGPPPPGQRG